MIKFSWIYLALEKYVFVSHGSGAEFVYLARFECRSSETAVGNMDAYAVCLTAVIGRTRKTVFSMINSINLDMTFNELFKDCVTQKKKNDADEKGNVRQDQKLDVNLVRGRVSAGPNE